MRFSGLIRRILDEHRSDTLHTIISNAAALPQVMKEKIIGHFGQILHETYGSTEASIVSNLRPADQLRKVACVGPGLPGHPDRDPPRRRQHLRPRGSG